jgi:hypothetical protein
MEECLFAPPPTLTDAKWVADGACHMGATVTTFLATMRHVPFTVTESVGAHGSPGSPSQKLASRSAPATFPQRKFSRLASATKFPYAKSWRHRVAGIHRFSSRWT